MRAVTTATAAAALGVERKALDNMLARVVTDELRPGRQGVERRIPVGLLEALAITAQLVATLGVPVREAFAASKLLLGAERGDDAPAVRAPAGAPADIRSDSARSSRIDLGAGLTLTVNLPQLRAKLEQRVAVAIESVVRRPRGRPRVRE